MSRGKADKVIVVHKRKRKPDDHHGGAWKVAYADFITAMMAFFLVMWIVSLDEDMREGISDYFQDPFPSGFLLQFSTSPGGEDGGGGAGTGIVPVTFPPAAEDGTLAAVARRLRDRVRTAGFDSLGVAVEIELTAEGLRIEMMETGEDEVFFERSSARLRPTLIELLGLVARELDPVTHEVVVEGHTDALAFRDGATRTNWELSVDRANAARRTLESAGLPGERVIEVRGLAERHPRIEGDPYDPRNRRISLLLPWEETMGGALPLTGAQVPFGPTDTPLQLPGTGPVHEGAWMLPEYLNGWRNQHVPSQHERRGDQHPSDDGEDGGRVRAGDRPPLLRLPDQPGGR